MGDPTNISAIIMFFILSAIIFYFLLVAPVCRVRLFCDPLTDIIWYNLSSSELSCTEWPVNIQTLSKLRISVESPCDIWCRHGAEQYTGDLELIFSGYHLDRTVPKIPEPVYCLMPSLLRRGKTVACLRIVCLSVCRRMLDKIKSQTCRDNPDANNWNCMYLGHYSYSRTLALWQIT